jgi:capsular polysaccharide biosynthesis protein
MTKRRIIIVAAIALIGAVLGAGLGAIAAPTPDRYTVSANVVMVPPTDLTTAESSSFWDVLTGGQVTRTAAIVYDDARWLPSAAKAAGVPQSDLTVTAAALPDTTVATVTVTAGSSAAAEAALNDVLTTAAPEVAAVTAPFQAKVLPTQGSAQPVYVPGRTQVAAAGALAGLLVGGSIGWFLVRRNRARATGLDEHADDVGEDGARHRS